jgi:hypothetical protein
MRANPIIVVLPIVKTPCSEQIILNSYWRIVSILRASVRDNGGITFFISLNLNYHVV